MTDVIFNGSTGRKPVGQASIELLFDNRDGSLGGPYAQYAEIAVKRLVTREAQSSYFFNGQKCRRRDIADLFLGTGLGPRSYAIIGQGMISRLIEARPEELRATPGAARHPRRLRGRRPGRGQPERRGSHRGAPRRRGRGRPPPPRRGARAGHREPQTPHTGEPGGPGAQPAAREQR